jgi:hypothetical protein
MTCNCKKDIEARLLERFKAENPDAEGHSVALKGYGLTVLGNTLRQVPLMDIECKAFHTTKAGNKRPKTEKMSMFFNLCPFCGVALEESP